MFTILFSFGIRNSYSDEAGYAFAKNIILANILANGIHKNKNPTIIYQILIGIFFLSFGSSLASFIFGNTEYLLGKALYLHEVIQYAKIKNNNDIIQNIQ